AKIPAISIGVGVALIVLSLALWPSGSKNGSGQGTKAQPSVAQANSAPSAPNPSSPPPAAAPATAQSRTVSVSVKAAEVPKTDARVTPGNVSRLELEASEPTWVSLIDVEGTTLVSRMLEPGDTRSLELSKNAILRTGNAGGLILRFNGAPVG